MTEIEEWGTRQFLLTVAAGKRLIAKAVAQLGPVKRALADGTVVVLGGSTNGYVAQELLRVTGAEGGSSFDMRGFYRGVTVAPGCRAPAGAPAFAGDLVFEKGRAVRGKTIFDVADGLKEGDVVIKGANAVDAGRKLAGILIGHPQIGTSGPILQAAVGRRVELILPVGLEKRVWGDLAQLAAKLNAANASGPRMLPVTGRIVTELEAVQTLAGCSAELVAAGGIYGAEGSCRLALTGTAAQLETAQTLIGPLEKEPPFPGGQV